MIDFEAGPKHHNPRGTLHGGLMCDIADAAMGLAYASVLQEDEGSTTIELKMNFLRPVIAGHLQAVGRIVKAGRTIGLTECDITDDQGRLVARASSTLMTLRSEDSVAGAERRL